MSSTWPRPETGWGRDPHPQDRRWKGLAPLPASEVSEGYSLGTATLRMSVLPWFVAVFNPLSLCLWLLATKSLKQKKEKGGRMCPCSRLTRKRKSGKMTTCFSARFGGELGGMGDRAPRDKVGDGSNTEKTGAARGTSLAQLHNREGFWNSSGMRREGGGSQRVRAGGAAVQLAGDPGSWRRSGSACGIGRGREGGWGMLGRCLDT